MTFVASSACAAPLDYLDCPDMPGYAYAKREFGTDLTERFSGWTLPISTKRDRIYQEVNFNKTLTVLSGRLLLGSTVPGLSQRFTCEYGRKSPCINHVTGSTFEMKYIPTHAYLPAKNGAIVRVFLARINDITAIRKEVASCKRNIFKVFYIYQSLPSGYSEAPWTYWLFEETRSNVKVIKTQHAPEF